MLDWVLSVCLFVCPSVRPSVRDLIKLAQSTGSAHVQYPPGPIKKDNMTANLVLVWFSGTSISPVYLFVSHTRDIVVAYDFTHVQGICLS